MDNERRNFHLGHSKSGLPTITECGGGSSNTGDCQIICGADGQPIRPLFVPKGYSNGDHAIFAVAPGMCIITHYHSRSSDDNHIWQIEEIKGNEAMCLEIGYDVDGDNHIPPRFSAALQAAKDKGNDYHCRKAWYIA